MSKDTVKDIHVIVSPYHVGLQDHRVGAGPRRILANGLENRLKALGYSIAIEEIPPVDEFEGEIGRSFEVIRRIARAVDSAIKAKSFPIILSGNCNASVGVAAGLNRLSDFEIVWLDAHADLDSPDDVLNGYFDVMGVSMLNGESWKSEMSTVPGHRPVPLEKITWCGVRDLSEVQGLKLRKAPTKAVWGSTKEKIKFAERLGDTLDQKPDVPCLVHVDLDCLDESIGKVNEYASPGGLDEKDLLQCLEVLSRARRPVSLTVASFNPKLEGGGTVADVAVNAISRLMLCIKDEEWYSAQ